MSTLTPLIVAGLISGSVYGLAGVGLVLTYRTSGIFNFAHGTIAAFVAFAFYDLRTLNGVPWPLALVICVGFIGPVIGLLLERMARTLNNADVVPRVVATVGLIIGLQQLLLIRYGAIPRRSPAFLPTNTLDFAGIRVGVDQLIVVAIAAGATVSLSVLLRTTRIGLSMRAVVDNTSLLALSQTSPTAIRRWAWCIGAMFAGVSGVLLAPAIGLDAAVLTLLVVQAFGAAAIGAFTSLPRTFAGGLLIGVAASVSSNYVSQVPILSGIPASLPFLVLFALLVVAPRHWLPNVGAERRMRTTTIRPSSQRQRLVKSLAGTGVLAAVPLVVGTRLGLYTAGLAFAIVFLSLAFLARTSGQISLAQLAFAGLGGSTFSHLAAGAGLPWLAAVLLAALVAIPVGAVLAVPAVRLSRLYLALATFGFGLIMEQMVFTTNLMFGGGLGSLPAPRPSFAASDRAYYYVVLAFAVGSAVLVLAITRSRLGRLLRALSDSPTALSTHGVNLTVINVVAFCVAAFLAGLAGALLGPVTGRVSPDGFLTFSSLQLVAILALGWQLGQIIGSFQAAFAFVILPSYLADLADWFPVGFGIAAVVVATSQASADRDGRRAAAWTASLHRRLASSPVRDRLLDHGHRAEKQWTVKGSLSTS